MIYKVPDEYYFRIHHSRPRFKDDVENVLIYMATEIAKITEKDSKEFAVELNNAIRHYPGNGEKTDKTINNWRTEISSIFGLLEFDDEKTKPGYRARHLAQYQDMVEFFKMFLFSFQYPGAHIKVQSCFDQIRNGVKFKPAKYILLLLQYAESTTGKREYITKAEACHCIFNDLRCTRDCEHVSVVWDRIIKNRENGVEYDEKGDTIRYAGDILDYMEIANLLVCYDHKHFYSNEKREPKAVKAFIESDLWFGDYDYLYSLISSDSEPDNPERIKLYYGEINKHYNSWYHYINQRTEGVDFRTNLLSLLSGSDEEFIKKKEKTLSSFYNTLSEKGIKKAKETGDLGEDMIYIHECKRVRNLGRSDILHIIKPIPTSLAVGYDIQSVEPTNRIKYKKRYIEVKTTLTHAVVRNTNYRFHLTPNEISTAETVRDSYYVYRLIISGNNAKLFIIQNPVELFEQGIITMTDNNGADVSFDTRNARVGSFEELLTWQN